jgi:hypothetical protein
MNNGKSCSSKFANDFEVDCFVLLICQLLNPKTNRIMRIGIKRKLVNIRMWFF